MSNRQDDGTATDHTVMRMLEDIISQLAELAADVRLLRERTEQRDMVEATVKQGMDRELGEPPMGT
jgi:hypothetical protein